MLQSKIAKEAQSIPNDDGHFENSIAAGDGTTVDVAKTIFASRYPCVVGGDSAQAGWL